MNEGPLGRVNFNTKSTKIRPYDHLCEDIVQKISKSHLICFVKRPIWIGWIII